MKKGGMNTKLHAVTDANGRPLSFFMTAGQVSDYTGAAALLDDLPKAQWMLADRGYDAVIAITRSGTTTEVLEILRAIKGTVHTVALVGDITSPIMTLADAVV